jgi:ribosome maturation factor RimP
MMIDACKEMSNWIVDVFEKAANFIKDMNLESVVFF